MRSGATLPIGSYSRHEARHLRVGASQIPRELTELSFRLVVLLRADQSQSLYKAGFREIMASGPVILFSLEQFSPDSLRHGSPAFGSLNILARLNKPQISVSKLYEQVAAKDATIAAKDAAVFEPGEEVSALRMKTSKYRETLAAIAQDMDHEMKTEAAAEGSQPQEELTPKVSVAATHKSA